MTITIPLAELAAWAVVAFCVGWLVAEGCAAWRDRHPDNLEPLPAEPVSLHIAVPSDLDADAVASSLQRWIDGGAR